MFMSSVDFIRVQHYVPLKFLEALYILQTLLKVWLITSSTTYVKLRAQFETALECLTYSPILHHIVGPNLHIYCSFKLPWHIFPRVVETVYLFYLAWHFRMNIRIKFEGEGLSGMAISRHCCRLVNYIGDENLQFWSFLATYARFQEAPLVMSKFIQLDSTNSRGLLWFLFDYCSSNIE